MVSFSFFIFFACPLPFTSFLLSSLPLPLPLLLPLLPPRVVRRIFTARDTTSSLPVSSLVSLFSLPCSSSARWILLFLWILSLLACLATPSSSSLPSPSTFSPTTPAPSPSPTPTPTPPSPTPPKLHGRSYVLASRLLIGPLPVVSASSFTTCDKLRGEMAEVKVSASTLPLTIDREGVLTLSEDSSPRWSTATLPSSTWGSVLVE